MPDNRSSTAEFGDSVDLQVHEVVIVGSGLSGIAAAVKLDRAGIDDFVVLEKADRVGGTWRENTYPGCGVDIPSAVYCFTFNPNPKWSRNFASQPEVLAYIEDTVVEFGIAERLRFGTELLDASWSDADRQWTMQTTRGTYLARHVVFATGLLTEPKFPPLPGLETFTGTKFHSATWNHDIDLADKRVAVIGTGCSSVQIVPEIASVVDELTVFQRTPAWVVPRLDFPIPSFVQTLFRLVPAAQWFLRFVCDVILRTLALVMRRERTARLLGPVGRAQLRSQVPDPTLRAMLTPDFTIGCKRLLLSNTYLPALSRSNVTLLPHALTAVDGDRLIAADGTEKSVDVIVFATGFELRYPPIAKRIRVRGGSTLSEQWDLTSPEAYLATTVPSAPNAYLLLGPNIVMYNSLLSLAESQIDYVIDAILLTRSGGVEALEVIEEHFAAFNERVQRDLGNSVYNTGGCASFYIDEHGKNFVTWPWSTAKLRKSLAHFDVENYDVVRNRHELPRSESVVG